MDQILPEFDAYRNEIPEFVIKLYLILEKPENKDYICWHGEDQILIKSPRKVEERVLSHYFRHRHMSSFIRQLNMYKFLKINKMLRERGHMYFKHPHFKRGKIQQLTKIKRSVQKSSKTKIKDQDDEIKSEISIDASMERNQTARIKVQASKSEYQEIQSCIANITSIVKNTMNNVPESRENLTKVLHICNGMLKDRTTAPVPEKNTVPMEPVYPVPYYNYPNYSMLSSLKDMPSYESQNGKFAANSSFYYFPNSF